MSDLDENLTSILSDHIDGDIETPTTTELTDDSFNASRLYFDNLADCITGNDACLHQCSDENVSSLLESHLNELSQTENPSIVGTSTEQLDDVSTFDLDKPIESFLQSASSEFISQECSHPQLSIVNKSDDLQNDSTLLNVIHNDALDNLENDQSILGSCNEKETEISDILNDSENAFESDQCANHYHNHEISAVLNSPNTNAETEQTPELFEVNGENGCSQLDADRVDGNSSNEDEYCETIVADEVSNEFLVDETKQEVRKRRRILVYNDKDSENSELDEERERLLHSPQEVNDENLIDNTSETAYDPSDDEKEDHIDDEDNYIRDPHEKPGPKSKKQSTHLYNALKAKALLESAIVIPARKKKKRVIHSDDEYNALNQPIADVDDIGLIPDEDNQLPSNVSIEIEQKEIIFDEVPKIRIKSDLIQPSKDTKHSKKESLSRSTTQAKMEKYHANRRNHKKKESTDIFGIPLNAPYVDSSSDEDYFLPQDTTKKNHSQRWSNGNGNSSHTHQRRKKGHIPDDIYFNAKVPLNVLYSYDDSSSDDNKSARSTTNSIHSLKPSIESRKRSFNKMPTVHKIMPKSVHGKVTIHKTQPKLPEHEAEKLKTFNKPTVFEQLDKLKRLFKVSGIKINLNDLLKGSKTFQERCKRIRYILNENGIEGEPTMTKCKKLRKQLKLKEDMAVLDPSAIIETGENEGRPKRSTRRATRRNYIFEEMEDTKKSMQSNMKSNTSQLLQKMKEFIDSDSDYENDRGNENDSEHNQNVNSNIDINSADSTCILERTLDSNESNALYQSISTQMQAIDESQSLLLQTDIENPSASTECTI